MIETAATLIVTLLLGYYLGTKRSPRADARAVGIGLLRELSDKRQALVEASIPVGPVKRPSAQQLEQMKKPAEVKAREQAVEDTLDQVPELVEAKKKVEAMKAAGSWIP